MGQPCPCEDLHGAHPTAKGLNPFISKKYPSQIMASWRRLDVEASRAAVSGCGQDAVALGTAWAGLGQPAHPCKAGQVQHALMATGWRAIHAIHLQHNPTHLNEEATVKTDSHVERRACNGLSLPRQGLSEHHKKRQSRRPAKMLLSL